MCYYNNRGKEQLKARKAVQGWERPNFPLFPKGHEIHVLYGEEDNMNEIVTVVTNAISNVGFPICCVGALGYLLYREQELHREESKMFTSAIKDLTVALTQLSEKLGGSEDVTDY